MADELERTLVRIYATSWFCTECREIRKLNSEYKPLSGINKCEVCGKKLKEIEDIEEVEMFVILKEDN